MPAATVHQNPLRSTISRIPAVMCLTIALCSSAVFAQIQSKWMVVNEDTVPVRCGDQDIYYTIAEFNRGTLLEVDGTSGEYSKVRYPKSLGAIVGVDEVRVVQAGSRAQLLKPSQLKAVSLLRGIGGSWCQVFVEPVEAETELDILEVIRDENSDEIKGYRVAPPRPPVVKTYPYAYIRSDSLREATPDEIAAQGKITPVKEDRPSLMPNPDEMEEAANDVVDDSTVVSSSQIEEPIVEEQEEPVLDLREEMVPPTESDSTESGQGGETDANQPVEIVNQIPVTQQPTFSPEKSTHISVASLEALEASFTNARSMPREQLDEALPELLAEFTRTRASIGDDAPEATPIDQRIEWLKIRIQTRDTRRVIAQALAVADEQQVTLSSKIEQWNATRVYNLVGRMTLSSVYTGEHLPLMYRIRTTDPITGIESTAGYIAPKDGQDLRRYLGSIVGVIGDPVRDDALALTVINPTRVDLMPGQ